MYFEDDQSCILQLDADIYEERFRVDRRKLEEMLLQVDNRTCCDRAEVFFQTIMDQTDTHISWPSRLKIGAKSKKDPHIKVMGTLAAVQSAKDSILDVLDTKCNRVTLKIDVSHTEHSHVIGKGGNNIKKVMQETGCHIHFPDSNRNSQMEKSNQVSIAGAPAGAEKARSQIRELLPLVFMFDLPIRATSASVVPDSSSPHVQHIQQLYNVTVTFKPRPRMYVTQVLVRGTVVNANSVKEGTASVMKLYAGNMANSIPVSVTMEIAPQHHVFIMGRGGSSVQAIMQRTGASILFPDPSNVVPQRKGTVYITGHIDNVYLARGLLIGCLPLVLMFDIKHCQQLDPRRLAEFMEQLDVFISIKPKPKQSNKSVIVKSTERNVANMYEARRLLLGLEPDSPTRLDTNSINIPSRMPPTGVDQNLISHPPWQYLPQNAGTSPLVLAGPVNPTLPRSFDVHERIINFTISDYNHNATQFTYAKGFGGHYDDSSADGSCYGDQASPSVSPSLASKTTVAMNSRSRTSNNSSTTSGMSTDSLGSADFSMQSDADRANSRLTETKTSPSDSGSSSELSGLRMSPQTSSPIRNLPPPPGIVHPSASKQSLLLEENIKNAHVPFCNSDSGSRLRQCLQAELSLDKRAPGTDRPVCLLTGLHHLQLQQQIHNITNYDHDDEEQHHSPINYEEKKMLATLAMQKKPEGESRFPTDYWAGLGFSKSMPDSAIRQKLKAANARYLDSVHANSTISEANENGDMDNNPANGGLSVTANGGLSVTANGGLSVTAKPGYPAPGNYIRAAGLPSHSDWSPSSSGSSGSCRSTQQTAPTNMAEHRKAPTHITEQSSAPTNIDDHRRAPTNKDQQSITTSNVAELFVELGLDKYTDKFLEQEIDLCTFLTLTDQDLRELGISKFGARRKMMLAIADLQKQCQPSVSTVAAPAILCDVGKASSQLDVSLSSKNNHLSPVRHPFSHQTVFSRQHNDIMSQSGRW